MKKADNYQQLLHNKILPACRWLYPVGGFIHQQDGVKPHTADETQKLLRAEAPGFIARDEWPASSPDLNPCDYRLWALMNQRV